MASKHWTFRILRYAGIHWGQVRVVKDGTHEPIRCTGLVSVGQLWLQDNFPFSYAGFLSFLAKGHTSEWHSQGYVDCSAYDSGEILGPEALELRYAKSIDKAEQREQNRLRKERELIAWSLVNHLITDVEAIEMLKLDSKSITKFQLHKKLNM